MRSTDILAILILCLAVSWPAAAQPPLTVTATAPAEPLSAGMLFTIEIQIDGATAPHITIAPVAGLQLIETFPEQKALTYAYFHVTATDARRIDIPIRVDDGQGNSTVVIVPIVVNGGALWRRMLPMVWK